MVKDLGDKTYEKQLNHVVFPAQRRLKGALTAAYSFLIRGVEGQVLNSS